MLFGVAKIFPLVSADANSVHRRISANPYARFLSRDAIRRRENIPQGNSAQLIRVAMTKDADIRGGAVLLRWRPAFPLPGIRIIRRGLGQTPPLAFWRLQRSRRSAGAIWTLLGVLPSRNTSYPYPWRRKDLCTSPYTGLRGLRGLKYSAPAPLPPVFPIV